MRQRRARQNSVARVNARGQRLVVHHDHVRRVFGDIARARDDDGDRLADETDLVLRQRPRHVNLLDRGMRHVKGKRAVAHGLGQVGLRQHGDDAGEFPRLRRVNAFDQRVGVLAAHEGRVQHARHREVVDEAALAEQQRRIFLALDAGAKDFHAHQARSLPASRSWRAASSPASTIAS